MNDNDKKLYIPVNVLETKDTWFGVTYQEDKASVTAAFKKLAEDGVYPAQLYK